MPSRPAAGASRWRRCRESTPRPTPGRRSSRAAAGWWRSGGRPARPGRTTVAVNVAAELAASGVPTLLADADVYGGVVAQVLGFLDEAPGLAAATRLANNGQLDLAALAAVAPQAAPNLRVLTGISRADRWPELRPSALEQVWLLCRSLAAVTVVDLGFCLEQDEELSFDTAAPRRNGATLATLDAADTVLAVGAADPVGMQRLVRGLTQLREVVPGALAAGGAQPGPARRGRLGARGPARRGAGALRRGARPGVRAGGPRVPRRGAAAGPRPARGRRRLEGPRRAGRHRGRPGRPTGAEPHAAACSAGEASPADRDVGDREVQRGPRAGRPRLQGGRHRRRLVRAAAGRPAAVARGRHRRVAGHRGRRRPVRRGLRGEPGRVPPAVRPDHPVERADRDDARAAGDADQQPVRQVCRRSGSESSTTPRPSSRCCAASPTTRSSPRHRWTRS